MPGRSGRLADRVGDSFSLSIMPTAGSPRAECVSAACRGDAASRSFELDRHSPDSRIILDGPPECLFHWLVALDGSVGRLLLCPRTADADLRERLQSEADCVIVAGETDASRWRLPVCVWCPPESAMPVGPMDGITDRAFVEPPLGACDSGSCRWIDTEWVLATSGTTATPKLVVHSLASLMRAVKAGDRYHGYRWGLVYDVARFAGLQVALQAAASGTRLLVADPEASLDEQVAWLASERCNALSATPTLWRRLLMTVGVGKLPLRQITLGGEIADLGVLRALAARFPAAHITHVYASTEAGVGFAVHDALPGFPARWLDDANRDVRLRIGEDGCLWVLSRRRDYDADPLYLGETRAGIVNDGWINTGDLVERRDGRVYFLGRLNGSINVGGNKVFPEMVEAFIREVDGVEAVLVRGKPSSVMGNLVEALVKPGPSVVDVQSLVRQVKEHCKARLADYQRPAFVRIVEGLGISATGKLER